MRGRRLYGRVVVGGLVGYLVLLGAAAFLGEADARAKATALLDNAALRVEPSLSDSADTIITYLGSVIVRACGDPRLATADGLAKFRRALSLDEITVVDGRGFIVCSTETAVRPGQDFHPAAKTRGADYSRLLKGESSVVEPIRGSHERPELRIKYGGVAFPDGKGFVQVGFNEFRLLREFDDFYENTVVDWSVGETGYFILANPSTGRIVSSFRRADVGKTLAEVVPDLTATECGSNRTKRLRVFGEPCLVRDLTCIGHRVLIVLPVREVVGQRRFVVGVTAVLLLVVFAVFGLLARQFADRARRERERQEAQRRQVEKDLLMAKDIQANSLPSVFPPYPKLVDRIDLHATMRTAREVGGDFYDFYRIGEDRLVLVVADVSGKGVPAALFMMRAKTTLQGLIRGGDDIADAVAEVNERLAAGNDANMFVTAWVGVVDLCSGRLEFVNAGHNPPVLWQADGNVRWVRDLSGPPLAAYPGLRYRKHELRLKPGDGLFLYTDGVTEANDPAFALYGEDRLLKEILAAAAAPRRTSRELCEGVLGEIDRFAGAADQADDITLLAFALNGVEKTFPATEAGLREAQPYLELFQEDPKPAIIMDEIVSNIVRCSGAQVFSTRFVDRGGCLEMTFTDDGRAFDPTTEVAAPDLTAGIQDREIGGLGIFMVKKMSRSVTYARVDGRNVLTVQL